MALKAIHDTLAEIPEGYRPLYTEKNGKFELTGIDGIKTAADIERVQTALTKERNDHKATRDKLGAWGDLDPAEVTSKLDRLPELEAVAKGKLDDSKIEEIVARRVDGTLKSKLAPIERENKTLKQQLEEERAQRTKLEGERRQRSIHDRVRSALVNGKVLPEAQEDALIIAERVFDLGDDGKVVTRDNVGVTPGLEPEAWLAELQPKKAHWWPGTTGGGGTGNRGGGGGGSSNPWSHDGWNLTEQGQYQKRHGTERAEQMAKAAGTKLGGPKPAKKA
jgi:hypothetical protein